MVNSVYSAGILLMILVFFSSCHRETNNEATLTSESFIVRNKKTVEISIWDKSINHKSFVSHLGNGKYRKGKVVLTSDMSLTIRNFLRQDISNVALNDTVPFSSHQFFGDPESGTIYSTSFKYSNGHKDGLYKYNLENGEVDYYPAEVNFTSYGECFGRSLIQQHIRNDTFYLCFKYPYASELGQTPGQTLWDFPNIGMATIENDSVKFIKAFGLQRPNFASGHVWQHPKFTYIPERNMILFSNYYSDTVLVYNFQGELINKIHNVVKGYDESIFYATTSEPGCYGRSEWHKYMADSAIYFSEMGYMESIDMFYRTVNFPLSDERNAGILFFDEKGNQKLIAGFEAKFPFLNPQKDGIYQLATSFDSLHYRVTKYDVYDYPEGFFTTETVLRGEN